MNWPIYHYNIYLFVSSNIPFTLKFILSDIWLGTPALSWFNLFEFNISLLLVAKDSQESSPTLQFKSINSLALSLLYGPTLPSVHDYRKNHSFDHMDFCGKRMSLLFNTLSRQVIAFLLRSKGLLMLWLQSPSTEISEPRKIKSITASTFLPSICHEMMGQDAMIFVFWMLSFKPSFSLSFTLIKKLFSSTSLSALQMVSSVYLRLLICLLAVSILACDSSSLAFCMCTMHIN